VFEVDSRQQQAFAAGLSRALRESRRRQKLTQAETASRTNGLISKTALAGYETGHRSIPVHSLPILASALGEDMSALVSAAERQIPRPERLPVADDPQPAPPRTRRIRSTSEGSTGPVTIWVIQVVASSDPRVHVLKSWVEMRLRARKVDRVTLDADKITGLALLLEISTVEARRLLEPFRV
jgi:transcriptional regulator with XRE-family HTH domain